MKVYSLYLSNDQVKDSDRRGVFVNAAHHARELTSVSLNYYLLLKLIYNYKNKEPTTIALLQECILYFLPIVNIDGYSYISDYHHKHG